MAGKKKKVRTKPRSQPIGKSKSVKTLKGKPATAMVVDTLYKAKLTGKFVKVNLSPTMAKIFMTGRSQAVRLPKEFRFECDEVYIEHDGDKVILSPKPSSWEYFFKHVPAVSDDFMETRQDPQAENREFFD